MQTSEKITGNIADKIIIRSIGPSAAEVIKPVNKKLFGEDRIINHFDHDDLLILTAYHGERLIGFKIGYRLAEQTFYSAKSGVLSEFRRQGVATKLLYRMVLDIKKIGYDTLVFDTFPNRYPGMMDLGLKENFHPVHTVWNDIYKDYQVRMERRI